MSIETEKWVQDVIQRHVIRDSNGRMVLTVERGGIEATNEIARAVVVLPEVLAALKDAAQYEVDDGPCWCMSPCRPGRPEPKCARNRDILRRAGVLT